MPNLFRVGGYLVFFWSNENGEPIHVHFLLNNKISEFRDEAKRFVPLRLIFSGGNVK